MRFLYRLEPDWPVLAWLAECHADFVLVRHGRNVESRPQWFCEAVWDGPFDDGGFDATDIVAGSGGRLRGDSTTFVPAGSTLDRLHSISIPAGSQDGAARVLVSNSLPCLFAVSGATLDPYYRHYRRDVWTIVRGLKKYKRTLETSLGPCRLWYFHNVRWDGRELAEVEKPSPQRDFSSFEPYHAFLTETLAAVARNADDPHRRHRYGLIGTMSSGYDSTTVSALARDVGLKQIITFDVSRGRDDDSGTVAARHLGLEPLVVRREAWQDHDRPEVSFMCADGYGEDRFFLGAAEHLRGKLLLTGFHGDKIWSKSPYGPDSLLPHPELKRGDRSGLTLTEYRLSEGFIQCPVPFWGARQIHEVVRVSRDPAMKPWDVPGDYSRPICRRIAEGRGVPREAFGVKKRAGSVLESVLEPSSHADYRAWGERHGIRGDFFDRVVRRGIRTLPAPARDPVRKMFYSERVPTFRDHYFPWALDRRRTLYRATAAPAPTPGDALDVHVTKVLRPRAGAGGALHARV
jgi:hypothetical protein